MKNKLNYILILFIIIGISLYLLETPVGSLRFAVLRCGYPINATNLELSTDLIKKPFDIKNNQTIYTIINPPVEKQTQSPLENWIVSKYKLFYWCEFYGW